MSESAKVVWISAGQCILEANGVTYRARFFGVYPFVVWERVN